MKNYSKQREEILTTLKEINTHPTAEDIYTIIKSKDPLVSRSTVYRNLGLLAESGIVEKIPVANKPDKYDYIRKSHHHVICTLCGKAFDFEYNFSFNRIKNHVKKQTDVDVEEKGIVLQGICNECKKDK